MSRVALTTAFTGATWDIATQSIIFSNYLGSNLAQTVITSSYPQTSNHFCDMLCFDPVSQRILRLDFQARDLLLYEWHTRYHNFNTLDAFYGITTNPTLNDYNRENFINLRRNIRQTLEYSLHESWHPAYRGDKGAYGPHALIGEWRRALILCFDNPDSAYHLDGIKSISSFSYVWAIGPGDWGIGGVYMLVLYYGMSWASVSGSYQTGDYEPHDNNSWPYKVDTRMPAYLVGRLYQANYLVAT